MPSQTSITRPPFPYQPYLVQPQKVNASWPALLRAGERNQQKEFEQQSVITPASSGFNLQPPIASLQVSPVRRCLDRSGLTDQPIITGAQVPLAAKEASKLLKGEKAYTNTCISFYNAKGGEVYLFCAQTDGEVDDWRKGKHNFRQLNGGQSGVLSNEFDEGMTKKVARIVTKEKARGDARFQRISWWYPSRPTVILIQFLGNEAVSQPLVHGNSRRGRDQPRSAMLPSVRRSVEKSGERATPMLERMSKEAGSSPAQQRLFTPHSRHQIRTLQHNMRKKQGRQDVWESLFRISREFSCVHLFVVSPRILLLIGDPEMIKLAGDLMKNVSWEAGKGKQCLGYDTQFQVGPYYVSTLTMRDPRRVNRKSGSVCILTTFMVIHDRKFFDDHDLAFSYIAKLLPQVSMIARLPTPDLSKSRL